MISAPDHLSGRLDELKSQFDAAFAALPAARATEFEDLLSIAIGPERYMVRLSQVAGLYLDCAITALPSAMPHLLGVSEFRGELVAVYDLAAVLGYPRADRARFLLRAVHGSVAFAFDRFVGHVRLSQDMVAPQTTSQRGHARVAGATLPLIDLVALVAGLEECAHEGFAKEG
jgi:purine-binding chemotaxis protein CheW